MGYDTDFSGKFLVTPKLKPEHIAYLKQFNETRRMKRNENKTALFPDPIREAVNLPIGIEAEFFVGAEGVAGQYHSSDIIDYNSPPHNQPGLWCKWTPTDDGSAIQWDQCEKFYDYVEWLEYLIMHFLDPWGYQLNGEVTWEGEVQSDIGKILVRDNEVQTIKGE